MYTYNSDEALSAGIEALPAKYPMELNRSDMATLMRALQQSIDEEANDLLSGILTTLGIEAV